MRSPNTNKDKTAVWACIKWRFHNKSQKCVSLRTQTWTLYSRPNQQSISKVLIRLLTACSRSSMIELIAETRRPRVDPVKCILVAALAVCLPLAVHSLLAQHHHCPICPLCVLPDPTCPACINTTEPIATAAAGGQWRILGAQVSLPTELRPGHLLRSPNGQYFAVLQFDGNFVVYVSSDFRSENARWHTNSHSAGLTAKLAVSASGRMSVSDAKGAVYWWRDVNRGHWVWGPFVSATHLAIQDDGVLVVYGLSKYGRTEQMWSSK